MNRQHVTLFLMCFFSLNNTFAQSRENKTYVKLESQSDKLSEAVGWKLNNEKGKWIENENVIEDKVCPNYWISYVSQNFKWIQFATIEHKGIQHYVLLYERLGGEYKYPNIREDWESNTQSHFFIIDSVEYLKLKVAIDKKDAQNIKITSKIFGSISDRYKILGGEYLYNEQNLLAKITLSLDKPSYSETCFIINSQKLDGVDIVRFRLPESCYFAEKNMKEGYFEVPFEKFSNILIN